MPYLAEFTAIQSYISNLTTARLLWVDTEVADFQSQNPRLSLIQVLVYPQKITSKSVDILDVLDYPELIAEFIETVMVNPNIEKVFHHAKYDRRFLGKQRVQNLTCTLEMAKSIPFCYLPVPNYQLKTLALHLTPFSDIDKQEQSSDWGQRPLTSQQLNYAAMDVVYLAQIHSQLCQLQQQCCPDPATDNLSELITQYQAIQHQWKLLDSEIEHLKSRIKQAMVAQNIQQTQQFKLSTTERKTTAYN